VHPHDQTDPAFCGSELLEEQGEYEKQSDAHKEEEKSQQGDYEIPVPEGFFAHLKPTSLINPSPPVKLLFNYFE
jgi:hypothetical protein